MKKSGVCLLLYILLICLTPQTGSAQTGYVSDLLLLTFREGPGTSYTVIKTLPSNTRVRFLDEQNGFYRVQLDSEEIGWVDKKFITFDPPKSFTIARLEQQIASLEKGYADLEEKHTELKNQLSASKDENLKKIQALDSDLSAALAEKKELAETLSESKKNYDTLIRQSRNIQNIVAENKSLKEENTVLNADLELLKKKNQSQLRTGMIKWFLAGVGTLLVGWILGGSITSRKRSGSSLLD